MVRAIILQLVFAGFFFVASAQVKVKILHNSCGFTKVDTSKELYAWDANDKELEYVKMICNAAGINQNFIIKRAAVDNAMATINDDNNRVIYYSAGFFSTLHNDTYKIAILAHEIAHHLNNNVFTKDSRNQKDELDADKFAGSILCKLGLKLEDAKALVTEVCPLYGEGYYPARSDRLEAFSIGFEDAGCGTSAAAGTNNPNNNHQAGNPIIKPNLTGNTMDLPFNDGHFVGNGFTVDLPANFKVRASIRSVTTKGPQSYFFMSPEGDAEFYIFLSPWGNEANDIAINTQTETLVSNNVARGGEIIRYDIKAKDGSYERAYMEVQSQKEDIHLIKGIKYKSQAAYNTYYPLFRSFYKTTSKPSTSEQNTNSGSVAADKPQCNGSLKIINKSYWNFTFIEIIVSNQQVDLRTYGRRKYDVNSVSKEGVIPELKPGLYYVSMLDPNDHGGGLIGPSQAVLQTRRVLIEPCKQAEITF